MTIIPRALVQYQIRCDVQNCRACGRDHVGLMFRLFPEPYGVWSHFAICPGSDSVPVLMRESEAEPFAKGKDD